MGEAWRARDADARRDRSRAQVRSFRRARARIRPRRAGSSGSSRPRRSRVRALTRDGKLLAELPRRKDDFFEALIPSVKERPAYRVEVETAHGTYVLHRPLRVRAGARAASTTISLREGTHRQLYRRLGAQLISHEGVDGVLFAVWAPNATRVSVVGDFNRWDGRRCQMRKRFDSGLWEIFVPELTAGAVYKYELARSGRRAAAAQGRSVRLRGRAQALDRLGRRRQRRFRLDRRRIHGQARRGRSRGASRCRSTRSISARGGAAKADGFSPTTNSPTS